MIIYIVGYGRSGTTELSRKLAKKLNAVNLGEVKYLYRNNKDDLLDAFWIKFKNNNQDLLAHSNDLKSFDNVFGFLKWNEKLLFKKYWDEILQRIGVDPSQEIIIDSSKTTLDSFMRGLFLYKTFEEVYFLYPRRNFLDIITSLTKGKNSNLERGKKRSRLTRILHVIFVGIPHIVITKVLTQIYRFYGLQTINLNRLDQEIEYFVTRNGIRKSHSERNIPIIYGNRSRKKNPDK